MQAKYIFEGRFSAGSREDIEGPLTVYVDDCSMSVVGRERTIGRSMLSISPFQGCMFFGTSKHSERTDVLETGYELVLSGITIGVYDDGGGKDGEFDVFRIRDVRIKGTFGSAGLTINVRAQTWPGMQICYSAQEQRENAYEPIKVTTQFIVPPRDLQAFMGLRFSIDHEMFARFNWSRFQ
ncbi:hypothetical protein FN976_18535 [Caenimonas sedimenti]|uniref:Uncharacterized protein n=1 Tax=Caenimonas sedimenti TaxID=2596921 RepID=A0A562ZND4_9BURK|nr:hypothetical protein [Caenimonas sedimenti]TWO69815.1 hypothetical protein FN976_18535 [Caenimonas sedimenti]